MAPISLQDLRARLYDKAKAEKQWRFWGLYVHVTRLETLRAAYDLTKQKGGARGVSGGGAGRAGHTHLSATADPARRDTQGRREGPRVGDSDDHRILRGRPVHLQSA